MNSEIFECAGEGNSADFSPCRNYRYALWRRWSDAPYCMFVGLNPSTADEENNDPTIRKCIQYAKDWKIYGALCMVNLFAFRATHPEDMMAAPDPIGPDNDRKLKELAAGAGIIIAAWGRAGNHLGRDQQVMAMLPRLHCLKRNLDGSPSHPLYLRRDAKPYPLNF